jgi:hemerythrin-like metal-binding protein
VTGTRIANGIFWVDIPEADLRILCGCPADSVKHLIKRGHIARLERDGASYETGPNAILLSDMPVQNGSFANLAEFPLLQMLYRQGMILPGHPNAGKRPILIGLEEQVRSQAEYFFRGNYGLASVEEMMACGVSAETARELFLMKQWFAFGRIRPLEELVDLRPVDTEAVQLAPGVYVHRRGFNFYAFLSGKEVVEVDLSLGPGEEYESAYRLPAQSFPREEFSIIHIGEGDGWDIDRPCMASIVCFRGLLYLIDAGPHIEQTLEALGIQANEIQGVFHSHCHDDHFAGLPSLVHVGRRMRYFAAPAVRATTQKKMAALMGITEDQFHELFETHDLIPAEWNAIDGLEVKPIYAPHPVETTVFLFKGQCRDGSRTYAHFADISSFEVLEKLGDVRSVLAAFSREVLLPVDLKKLDVGGGLIHGRALDFSADRSSRIILSHGVASLSAAEQKIGTIVPFGASDTLISAQGRSDQATASFLSGRGARHAQSSELVEFLMTTRLFGSCILQTTLETAAAAIEPRSLGAGMVPGTPKAPELCLVAKGEVTLTIGGQFIERVGTGEFWGEEQIVHKGTVLYEARAVVDTLVFALPTGVLEGVPSVRWKLFEAFGRRMGKYRTSFQFQWQDFFSVNVREIDEQHRHIFALVEGLSESIRSLAPASRRDEKKRELISYIRFHFASEEELLESHGYSRIEEQKREHVGLLQRIAGVSDFGEIHAPRTADSLVDFLKEWLVRHTLLEDLGYKDFLREHGAT